MYKEILKNSRESKQYIDKDTLGADGVIEPFINFNQLLQFYYYNVYHQRSIKIKAALLSQCQESDLDKYLPEENYVKEFLYSLVCDLEIYGNAFLEKSGTPTDFSLYQILGYQGRLNAQKEILQVTTNSSALKLEGYHLKYYSPHGKYYGEPDYLTALEQIITTKRTDQYNTSFFENGARPGFGVIFENSSPNKEQVDAFKDFFGSSFKGHENAHKTLLLHTGKTPEGSAPAKVRLEKLDGIDDMSFEKLKKVSRDDIVAAHGVPPRLVGIMAAGQLGGGAELIDQLHAFNEMVIKPKANLIEDFFANIGIKHVIKPLDVTNFKDDSSLVTNLVNSNIISTAEAKEILGIK